MYVDIALGVIVGLFALIGAKKGFSSLILKLSSTLLAAIAVILFSVSFRNFLVNQNFLWISGSINDAIQGSMAKTLEANNIPLDSDYGDILNNSGIIFGGFLERYITKLEGLTPFENITLSITNFIMLIISVVIINVAFFLVFFFIKKFIKKRKEKGKVFKIVDTVFGIFGYSLLFITFAMILLSVIYAIPYINTYTEENLLNTSVVTKYIYYNNPLGFILDFFVKLFK